MDAETRAAHAAHALHVATGEGVPVGDPAGAFRSHLKPGEEIGDIFIFTPHPAPEPVKTNRQAHEEAAGMGLEYAFFKLNGIDPDAPAPEPVLAPTVDAGPVENASEQAHRCYHQWTRSGHRTAPAPPAAAPDPRDALLNSVRVDLGTILANTLNPAHTMTGRGLEEVVDACHEIAGRALAKLEPKP